MINKCPNCRALFDNSWRPADRIGFYTCPYCNLTHDMEADSDKSRKERSDEYSKIYSYLENLRFKEASDELRTLRSKYKTDASVYFLSALADNFVCYTNNDNKTKWPYDKIPTLNNIQFKNILKSEYVKKAIELASSEEEKCMYQKTFEYMESVREKIEAAYNNGEYKFDVFISAKVNKVDENGNAVLDEYGAPVKTTDYGLALGIYELIEKMVPNCRIFLSEKKKDLFIGKEYENIIFSALHTSKVFILVGNTRDNVDSNWVRNEWMRYLYLMDPKSEGAKDRHFVFVTQGMSPSDIPGEFRDLEHVFWGQGVGQETRLIDFIKKGVESGKKVEKIKTKDFDTVVGEIKQVAPKGMNTVELKFGADYTNVDADVVAMIDNAINTIERASKESGSSAAKARREDAFKKLENIADKHEDAYKARLYLLMRNTSYGSFENYFCNVNEIANNPSFAMQYFDNASKTDAEKMIKSAVKTVTSSLNGIKTKDTALEKNAAIVVEKIISGYLEHVDRSDFDNLKSAIEKWVFERCKTSEIPLLKSYLLLSRFADGDNPQKYIDVRKNLLKQNLSYTILPNTPLIGVANEILAVNSGDVFARWFICCSKFYGAFLLPSKMIEKGIVAQNLKDDATRSVWLKEYETMFGFAPKEETSSINNSDLITSSVLLRKFLFDIANSSWVYQSSSKVEDADDNIKLDGYNLFLKYIQYDLGTYHESNVASISSITKGEVEQIVTPSKIALKYSKNKTYLTNLILLLATKMHKNGNYDCAVELYKLYLAQRENAKALDCIMVRLYLEMAKAKTNSLGVANKNISMDAIDSIKLDLFILSENGKNNAYLDIRDKIENLDFERGVAVKNARNKKILAIVSSGCIALGAATWALVLSLPTINSYSTYNNANKLYRNGDYEAAENIYEDLGDFSDAKKQIAFIEAKIALERGDYATAKKWLDSIAVYPVLEYSGDLESIKNKNNTLLSAPLDPGYEYGWSVEDYTLNNKKGKYSATIKLKAGITPIRYQVTYDLNNSTLDRNDRLYPNYTVLDSIALPTPTKDDCKYLGWSDPNGVLYTSIGNGMMEDIELTAVLEIDSSLSFSNDEKTAYYGIYPQSLVTDYSVINKLNDLEAKNPTDGYYSLYGNYYKKTTAKGAYISYQYTNTYRTSRDKTFKIDEEYWFICEKIQWDVIKVDNGKYTLASSMLLDTSRFAAYPDEDTITDYQGNTGEYDPWSYKYSEVRSWLNTDFLNNAFPDSSNIQVTHVDNSAEMQRVNDYFGHFCEDTDDKVFLLSDIESDGKVMTTEYARARGALIKDIEVWGKNFDYSGFYWTRTPFSGTLVGAAAIDYNGKTFSDLSGVHLECFCVRPCITVTK